MKPHQYYASMPAPGAESAFAQFGTHGGFPVAFRAYSLRSARKQRREIMRALFGWRESATSWPLLLIVKEPV